MAVGTGMVLYGYLRADWEVSLERLTLYESFSRPFPTMVLWWLTRADWSAYSERLTLLEPGVQKVGTAGTAGAGQTTFGWTK